jgi:hypothetical protein
LVRKFSWERLQGSPDGKRSTPEKSHDCQRQIGVGRNPVPGSFGHEQCTGHSEEMAHYEHDDEWQQEQQPDPMAVPESSSAPLDRPR